MMSQTSNANCPSQDSAISFGQLPIDDDSKWWEPSFVGGGWGSEVLDPRPDDPTTSGLERDRGHFPTLYVSTATFDSNQPPDLGRTYAVLLLRTLAMFRLHDKLAKLSKR